MGLRRLRGRLDQLQGNANFTMGQAQELMRMFDALLEDIADGVGVTFHVDKDAAKTLMGLMVGKPGKLPLSVQVDPTVDTLPNKVCQFVGGSHDGKTYQIPDTEDRTITLKGGELYEWDGKVFQFKEARNADRPADQ